jgi:hypothetical protein
MGDVIDFFERTRKPDPMVTISHEVARTCNELHASGHSIEDILVASAAMYGKFLRKREDRGILLKKMVYALTKETDR